MNKILITALLLISVFNACNSKQQNADTVTQPNIAQVNSDDEDMNDAISQARLDFNIFDTAYKNHHYNKDDFSVKVRFKTDNGGEHIWADSITYKNGSYYGILDEDAVAVDNVKAGDRVKINPENISDWLFSDHGIMRGGYTIKVIRNKMSPEKRAHFDSTYYLKIVD
jgi:uncharacterized protein YegJ (DUF2314 family)